MKTTIACSTLVVAIFGCAADGSRTELSPGLEAQMQRYIRRVEIGRPETLFPDLAALSAFGRHAVLPVKEDLLSSDNPRVRSNAVYVLGEIYRIDGDEVALQTIREMLSDEDVTVRLEAARALLDAGDMSGVHVLIDGLDADNRWIRQVSFQTLGRAARDTFGYNPDADPDSRQPAVRRFREWARDRSGAT